jgi:hypothetical protein
LWREPAQQTPAMRLKKGKNYPTMISFLLSAEKPEHALKPTECGKVGIILFFMDKIGFYGLEKVAKLALVFRPSSKP